MKKFKLLLILFVGLLVASCSGLKKMQKDAENIKYAVTPSPLELHANKVNITIKGTIPPKYFKKKVIVEATPVLKWEDGEKMFDVKKLQGEKVEANNQVISNLEGGSFSYTGSIPYQEGMRISDLEIRLKGYVDGKKDKALEFKPIKIADGVIATPSLLRVDGKGIIAKDKFQRIVPETKYAEILYAIEQANIRGSEKKTEQMQALKDYIKQVRESDKMNFKGVEIKSYASPDGDVEDINAPLSEKRGKNASKYISRELKKTANIDDENAVKYEATAEDWEGFKELIQASNLQDKNLILRVLSMYPDPARREIEIKNISATYLSLAKEILPKLRRSKINVNVDLIGYSDDEITVLATLNADKLNVEELLYAATLYPETSKKIGIYEKVQAIYPDCWRGFNNAAVLYIEKNDLSKAKTALQKAKSLSSGNPIVMNNLAVVEIREGNIDRATELLTSANGAGKEVNYNKGIIAIKKGDYASAVSAFGTEFSYNAGLAKILNGDNAGAIQVIDSSSDKTTWEGYYLKAIASARQNQANKVYSNLKYATEQNSKVKSLAKEDLEFAKYFVNDTFKSIVD